MNFDEKRWKLDIQKTRGAKAPSRAILFLPILPATIAAVTPAAATSSQEAIHPARQQENRERDDKDGEQHLVIAAR